MHAPAATVYLIANKVSGRCYVGVTRFAIEKRWQEHVWLAARQGRTYLHRAIRKYGAEAFQVTAVASCLDAASAGSVERAVIEAFAPEYNQTNGGEITVGRRIPREVVERIRAANTGQKRTAEQLATMSVSRKQLYVDRPDLREKIAAGLVTARANVNGEVRIAAVKAAQTKYRADPVFRRRNAEQLRAAKRNVSREGMLRGAKAAAIKKRKAVECTSLNTVFDSVLEASEATGVYFSNISEVCRGKRKSAGGLLFRFI